MNAYIPERRERRYYLLWDDQIYALRSGKPLSAKKKAIYADALADASCVFNRLACAAHDIHVAQAHYDALNPEHAAHRMAWLLEARERLQSALKEFSDFVRMVDP